MAEILGDVVGVALHCNLRRLAIAGFYCKDIADSAEDALRVAWRQLRRRASSKIYCGNGFVDIVLSQKHFPAEAVGIARALLAVGGGIEASIDAAAFAERNVNV